MNNVLIATSCRTENARYVDFYRMRDDLILPAGSKMQLFPGFFPEYSINDAVKAVIYHNYSHLFIIDDDQLLPPDTLMRLLNHNLDIVAVNLLTRTSPFGPYAFRKANENGAAHQICLNEVNNEGPIIEVDACGTGGILIKANVLKKMKTPCFSHDDILKTYDFYFCHQARKAGFKIHVDLSCPSGHMVIAAVWPKRINGEWHTTLIFNNSVELNIPSAVRDGKGNIYVGGNQISGREL